MTRLSFRLLTMFRVQMLFCSFVFALTACNSPSGHKAAKENSEQVAALPPLIVRDETTGLTFSYITNDGGFQLVQKVADVPYEARDIVRVWSEVSGDGIAGPSVYVADLRSKIGDGTYKIEVMARAKFEQLAEDRRAKKRPTSLNVPSAQKGQVTVIIYGADWCGPCKDAERYLKSRGIPFEHRDVDQPGINNEMRDKLRAAGMRSHSIPVIDVGGKLLIGFSAQAIDQALAELKQR